MSASQFPTPTFECRECGKPIEGHGEYCHPLDAILGGICIGLIGLIGIAMLVAVFLTEAL